MEKQEFEDIHNCVIKLRVKPEKRREKVYIGCGAGFGGDRPMAALKLLQRVEQLNYLVLECLAERTLADRFQIMLSGGHGYDSRISDWMRLLLPLAVERGTCIITNMGAMDPPGAQEKVLEIATSLGLSVRVAVTHEVSIKESGSGPSTEKSYIMEGSKNLGISTYLGAAPIVECLEKYKPNVIITSRVADAALFLAPMVGIGMTSIRLAQGSLASHLLECGCQLTGGFFMHPGDKYRNISFQHLLDISLPYAEVSCDGEVFVAKAEGSGGVLNFSTCAQQLLYEIGDPGCLCHSGCAIKFSVLEQNLHLGSVPDKLLRLVPKFRGWKGWGEISYGGQECVKRAKAAEYLDQAVEFAKEFTALYTNGPAGGGGISTGHKKEIILEKQLVGREHVFWQTGLKCTDLADSTTHQIALAENLSKTHVLQEALLTTKASQDSCLDHLSPEVDVCPAPSGQKIPLYTVCHSRVGDKGNDLNFSIIPHFPLDVERLKLIITPQWVKEVFSTLLNPSSFPDSVAINKRDQWINEHVKVEIYEVRGIHSLNVRGSKHSRWWCQLLSED
ncbi:hypothetical protein Patl1_00407 [Pistacia atlantica]|uniref:Uncharacterized protein n=1 Tax=Pistacia atlantica TaxID=434234 RepID=A0ACC1C4G2_9ROSI|nr:hypothetical protein Patl1_00407 [Pistacia atlantica]